MTCVRSKPSNFLFFFQFPCMQLLFGLATSKPIFYNCSSEAYNRNISAFDNNLNLLISSLVSKAPIQRFYNSSVGEEPYRVYGLFQCRGDTTGHQCQNCLNAASTEIKQTCPNSTKAVVWYDFCLVQYSNQYFFGLVQSDGFYLYNDKFGDKPLKDADRAVEFVSNLSKQAVSRPSMFATAASLPESIYSLVQCTMDVSKYGCRKCLQHAMEKIEWCCNSKRGWRYFAPSCSVRYEVYPFFNGSNAREELQGRYCPDDVSTASLAFSTHVNRLLSLLTSSAPKLGFFNNYFGDEPNRAYGLVLCRGDLNESRCKECLSTAVNDLAQGCPNKTQAILWYRECQLRYSNESFFGIADSKGIYITNNALDNTGSQSLELISRLAKTASEDKLMFAADQLRINETDTRYYSAQCTRDLRSTTCYNCLSELIQKVKACCIDYKGWHYFGASCNMRCEAYAFLNSVEAIAPAPQPMAFQKLIPTT